MSTYSTRIANWIQQHNIDAVQLSYEHSVHSVDQAISSSGYSIEFISKSIVLLDENQNTIIAMVPARFRVSTERVRKALSLEQRPVVASAAHVEATLQQQIGGNSPLNCDNAIVLFDPLLLETEWVITGGGDDKHLVKISTVELANVVKHRVARIRK